MKVRNHILLLGPKNFSIKENGCWNTKKLSRHYIMQHYI